MKLTRRAALSSTAAGFLSISGCAKVAVKGADEAASGADEVASGADDVGQGVPKGASALDDLAEVTTSAETTPHETDTDFQDINELLPLYSADEDVEIEEGYYRYWELFFSEDAELDVSGVELSYTVVVRNGPSVDVVLTSRDEFEYFRQGQSIQYYPEASRLDTEYANVTGNLHTEDYVLIVDNSGYGEAKGLQKAELSVEISGERI
ncbi:hypothetical protein ACFO0N_15275 [Halobium salinum]|uniref:Lipoprotein n=1 Tax=Halobium salinum TaxID=1364940 RepID=A0ABD5PEI5_9EURY|nr:hypothetical protein [Halobium salinum]